MISLALGKGFGFGTLAHGADGEASTFEKWSDALEGLFIKGYGEDRLFFFHRSTAPSIEKLIDDHVAHPVYLKSAYPNNFLPHPEFRRSLRHESRGETSCFRVVDRLTHGTNIP